MIANYPTHPYRAGYGEGNERDYAEADFSCFHIRDWREMIELLH